MTYNEALDITGDRENTDGLRNIGASYRLSSTIDKKDMWIVSHSGNIYSLNNYCFGVRPVVSLKSGVYIEKGTGTEEDKYILKME